ncbi:ATP-binding protein [Leucobacter insecticola]|uniref:ATP-binding protein n=1 Tax=Leucobacter insecticola TaxID=2714934 RepID=A0A6G8FJY5_9MICO|nr:ATP-binding protein [Leucobacter insecticola]QIM16780.1 ATP-binding protein [Leucobacter insecticola]
MELDLIPRNVTGLARKTLDDTPITVISGARQVGKSTLMQQLVQGRETRLVNLDNFGDRSAAQADPDGFASQYPQGLLAIDEIQRVPELLTSLKASVDRDRRPGRFIVTGSADLLSLRGAQESLAGRAETIPLEGFSRDELSGRIADFAAFAWALPSSEMPADRRGISRREYLEMAATPAFPEARLRLGRSRDRWLSGYVDRLLSKDAGEATGIQYPDRLATLLSLLAARNSGEFVASHVGRELDIPARSIPAYLEALRSLFFVRVTPGWSNNIARRAVSKPKVSLTDTGLAAHLSEVDVDGLEKAVSSSLTGGLVEGFVIGELEKQRSWSTKKTRMFHYRDDHGREIDIVLEDRRRDIVGIEVKASSSPRSEDFKGLRYMRDKLGERFVAGIVLHTGERSLPFGDRLWALPISTLWDHTTPEFVPAPE